MTKAALRKAYKTKRQNLSEQTREDFSLAIANQALTLPIWESQYYHLFLPIARQLEVNTEYLLHILQGKDKSVVVSKSNFEDSSLTHYLLEDHTVIKPNAWGIPEPLDGIEIPAQRLQVVFIPLLAYDLKGNRLGYGKGFYDRFLADCDPKVIKIGLSFFPPEQDIPNDPTDVPLNYCISPEKVYKF
ncbi:5-formyltetrahydrofolate cyclo-ligase [Gilvibacter sediminis]|uniref:5-formyltetrahydrofolate cyclo-ligase n=1 Tax=Gilvibacter sediminis TaxID=379071 RepID=UPI002350FE60|nr:5-formyltetrahydrofolate cyclo-ligase [Gilvibacter sediminis]MDC7997049.1 5-formyltetrahydrofolate cyclo-ligase [Gilvibacter sediminis]